MVLERKKKRERKRQRERERETENLWQIKGKVGYSVNDRVSDMTRLKLYEH